MADLSTFTAPYGVSRSAASSHQRPSYMLIGVSGKATHGTRIANVLDVIRIAAEWRKRGIIQIQIEDDEGRSYDPQTFEKSMPTRPSRLLKNSMAADGWA
jgi:hypothetical protein